MTHTHSHSVHTSQCFHEKDEQTCHSCASETETKQFFSFCAQIIFYTASNASCMSYPNPLFKTEQQKHTQLTEESLFTWWALTLVQTPAECVTMVG